MTNRVARAVRVATRKPNKLRACSRFTLVMPGSVFRGARFKAASPTPFPRRIERPGVWSGQTEARRDGHPGEYAFKDADRTTSGNQRILSSVGQYRGTLERIDVDGQTETPAFAIDISNQPVPLFTRFKAIVDGTNGDTWLDRVDARLGQSNIIASGAIVRERDVKGRHVALDIQI